MKDGQTARGPGRRPLSSRAALEDAAGELFLENTYSRTTVEQIAHRAGLSRASFFNYFGSKSDLLWGDVDLVIGDLDAALTAIPPGTAALAGIRGALLDAAAAVPSDRIPLAVTQWELMGARDGLLASGVVRFDRLARLLHRHLIRLATDPDETILRAAAFAVAGSVTAAASAWASGGPSRGDLGPMLDSAVSPVCIGFATAIT